MTAHPSPREGRKIVERHALMGQPDACVLVFDSGDVEVEIGVVVVTVERLSEIVAFVETHGQTKVAADA